MDDATLLTSAFPLDEQGGHAAGGGGLHPGAEEARRRGRRRRGPRQRTPGKKPSMLQSYLFGVEIGRGFSHGGFS